MTASGQLTEGVRQPVDRRAARTREAIDRAFLGELARHGYDAVSVSDIVREANVGRATFYEHFPSKDALLRAQLRRLLGDTLRPGAGDAGAVDASALFAHVRDVPILYRLIAGRSASARSMRVLCEALEERALQLQGAATGPAVMPPTAAARVWAATLCALLSWWSEQGMAASAGEMQAMLAAATTRGAP
jgi:AcrR family transcriptional regulator